MTEVITIEDWRKQRQLARTSLLFLCNNVLGYKDVQASVHRGMILSLQKFKGGRDWTHQRFVPGGLSPGTFKEIIEGYEPIVPNFWDLETPSATRRTLILMPRGHLKSTIMMGHMIQWILNYPNIRILLSSGTGDQVHGFLKEIKQHFQFNDMFRWLFPEFCPPAKTAKDFGNQDEFTVPNCRRPNAKEPTVGTVSVGAVVASKHYDVIDNDDVVDKENVRTPEQIQTVKAHLGMLWPLLETAPNSDTRLVGYQRGWWYLVGTTYDFSDAYGTVLDEEEKRKENKKPPTYHIYKQSALLEGELSEEECKTDCDLPKPHPVYRHCKTLWPARLPAEGLLGIAADPLQGIGVLNSQYLMNPIPDGQGLLASEKQIIWVPMSATRKIYDYLSLHCTIDLAGMEEGKKTSDNDYTVLNLHGFGHDGSLYIVSIIRGRMDGPAVIKLMFELKKIHPRLVDFKIEKEAHMRTLAPFLKREQARRGVWLNITPMQRDNQRSKVQRIKAIKPFLVTGGIRFFDNQPSKLAIIDEIMRFPKFAHDDILDTITDALFDQEGKVISDVLPQEKPNVLDRHMSVKLPDGSSTVPNFNPDLKNLMDRIWGNKDQGENSGTVDQLTGW